MYGKDPQSLEPYLLYSSTLAHNPQGTAPAKPLPIQKPRPYARHLHRGFVDKQNVWHPAEHNHGSPLGCVLEEDEELDEADDAKSVRNPGLRDSGYSSGSASSEDGEPDTPREGFFPASKQQMIDTQRSVKDVRQQHSLPVPIQHDNPSSNSRRTESWPSFRRTPNHIMPPKPLVAEEPYLIYSTPSPTNCLTPPIEKALIYSTFSPLQGVKPRHTLSPVSIGRTTISSLESSPLRSASNFYPSQPQEPIKPKYTSPFDPFAGDPSAFTPSPDDMVLTRNSRSRFA